MTLVLGLKVMDKPTSEANVRPKSKGIEWVFCRVDASAEQSL